MYYVSLISILTIILGIVVMYMTDESFIAMISVIGFLFIELLIFSSLLLTIEVENIKDSLVLVASQSLEAENLEKEIERVIGDELGDKCFDISLSVEESKLGKLDVYNAKLLAKSPVITKLIYNKERLSFRIFIDKSDIENFNKDSIKVVVN